jgi:protein-tyrosine kinase
MGTVIARHTSGDPEPPHRRELATTSLLAVPCAQLLLVHSPDAPRCEKVRALRTDLMLRHEAGAGAQVLALLSPCAGEGRSLLAADLACAFAQTGHPTLLVDADLRNPHQHVLFGAPNHLGLSRAMEDAALARPLAVRGLPLLSVLTAGPTPENPVALLTSDSLAALVQQWRESYRFVVIDTPPLMHFSDGLAVANLAGHVLTLSRARHTPYRHMKEMLRRLTATRSRILGAVISHF